MVEFADDARRVLQNLPMRIPKPVSALTFVQNIQFVAMQTEAAVWLQAVNGDPITGRKKGEIRRELFADEFEPMEGIDADDDAAGDVEAKDQAGIPAPEVTIDDPPSTGMPRAYLDGLSDVEFSVKSQASRHNLVVTRWEVNGSHTGTLLGQPATGRNIMVTGLTLLRFAEAPGSEGALHSGGIPAYVAIEEWSCWDLPSVLEQVSV
jgi:hypothetical protein